MLRVPTLLAVNFVAAFVGAQAPTKESARVPTGFLDKTIRVGEREHRYVLYVPPDYRPGVRWPLVMFLNGMGECGTDGQRQVEVGLGAAIKKDPLRWPCFVVFPQKPDKQSQWIEHDALVMATLAATEQEFPIDTRQRFLTGLSQGGAGTWAIGAKHADLWGAIAPVCGYGKPDEVAARLEHIPIWAFHGVDDQAVPVQQSKDLCAAVERAGGQPLLTLYENTAHNSWDKAYRESSLAEWLGTVRSTPALAAAFATPDLVQGRFALTRGDGSASPDSRGHGTWCLEIGARDAVCTFDPKGGDGADARVPVPLADARQLLMKHLFALRRARLLDSTPYVEDLLSQEWLIVKRGTEAETESEAGSLGGNVNFEVEIACRGLRWATKRTVLDGARDGGAALQWNAIVAVQSALARLLQRR